MVWINETDSAKNMDELEPSSLILGRILPDFEVLDSKISECSPEVVDR